MTAKGDKKRLRPKYVVRKVMPNGTEAVASMLSTDPDNIDSPFVLMPRKDPAAFAATIAYAQCCEPTLAAEIAEWLEKIASAPPLFGTQGIRNYAAKRLECIREI